MMCAGLCHKYQHGFVMIIPPPVENGSPFWILKIFDTLRGVSLVHMCICSYVHHTRVSQSIEQYQCNRIPNIIHSLSLVFSFSKYPRQTYIDIYVCTYEHTFMCQLSVYSWVTYERILMYHNRLYHVLLLVITIGGAWLVVVMQLYFIKCILIGHINMA